MPMIAARELERRFGATRALDRLSFTVERGELFGLVGADGAGKTTAIRALAGLIDLDGGRAEVAGRDPATGGAAVRESLGLDPLGSSGTVRDALGYMPQQYSLYGDLTVDENLRFFASMFCLPRDAYRERREKLLGITRLQRFTARRADALSGGMYKKLALACALLHRPRLLVLDEPTNGVDPVSRREFWDLLAEFVADGMAVLISTPYMDEAARCHRVGLIHAGRLLLEGEPGALLAGFDEESFEVAGGMRDPVEAALSALPQVRAVSPAGSRLRVDLEAGARDAVAAALQPLGAELRPVAPTFEDLFLSRLHREHAA